MPVTSGPALSARGVSVSFEGLMALDRVSLHLPRGEILGLIGPNGAGKTTLVNVLSGFQKPSTGAVHLDGAAIERWPVHKVAREGLARTFQKARLFADMTVAENVSIAALGAGCSHAMARDRAAELLGFFGLLERADVRAAALAYGEQRLVGIARALAGRPNYLLLDEPAAGLTPHEAGDLLGRIASIRETFGCGILIIEHNMQVVMNLCDRVDVLAQGRMIASGTPGEIKADSGVRTAYLGTGADVAHQGEQAGVRLPRQAGNILSVGDLTIDYGPVRAVAGLSLHVPKGGFVAMIGPNGAGKSTLLAAVTGLIRHRQGTIAYRGQTLTSEGPEKRVQAGIALVPEGRRIFSNLTVGENLRIGATLHRNDPDAADRLEGLLELFPVLRQRFNSHAGGLSGGEQQQLAIARALQSNPKLLLLDEPSLGLAPMVIDTVYETLVDLNRTGLSILLMEQNASRALQAADYAYVLRSGRVELEGAAADLKDNPDFDRAYFGFDSSEGLAAA